MPEKYNIGIPFSFGVSWENFSFLSDFLSASYMLALIFPPQSLSFAMSLRENWTHSKTLNQLFERKEETEVICGSLGYNKNILLIFSAIMTRWCGSRTNSASGQQKTTTSIKSENSVTICLAASFTILFIVLLSLCTY